MGLRVVSGSAAHCVEGVGGDVDVVNAFLDHLSVRNCAPATRRAYAFDLLNFLRFLTMRSLRLAAVLPTDLFDYLDWQREPVAMAKSAVAVKMSSRSGAAPATMNRRIAAVRGPSMRWWRGGAHGIRFRRRVGRRGCVRSRAACSVIWGRDGGPERRSAGAGAEAAAGVVGGARCRSIRRRSHNGARSRSPRTSMARSPPSSMSNAIACWARNSNQSRRSCAYALTVFDDRSTACRCAKPEGDAGLTSSSKSNDSAAGR